MTGIVLSALSQVPGAMARIDAASAQTFLAATRTPDAGHSLMADGSAHGNCDSTVWAIRADAALGLSADPHAWAFLATLRHTDGSYSYVDGGPANALCTAEAATLIALAAQGSVAPPPVPMPSSF
jgi:hypothetical protein